MNKMLWKTSSSILGKWNISGCFFIAASDSCQRIERALGYENVIQPPSTGLREGEGSGIIM